MIISGRNILFALTNQFPNRDKLVLCLDKNHIYQGKMATLKNQLPDFCAAPGLDPGGRFAKWGLDNPFKNERQFDFKWDFIGFNEELNGLVMEGVMKFSYGYKNVVVLLAADCPLGLEDTKHRYLLTVPWAKRKEIQMCLVVAESRNEARERKEQIFDNFSRIVRRKVSQYAAYAKEAPVFSAKSFPVVEAVGKTTPSFLRAMVLAETDRDACLRAANFHYGYFIGWDQTWPVKAFTQMGHWPLAKKLLRYPTTVEPFELYASMGYHDIITLEDFIAVTGDLDFLKEMYPFLVRYFKAQLARVSAEGLIAGGGYGVDDSHEIEIYGDVWAPDTNGWWYGACRSMENLAMLVKDAETERLAAEYARKIESHYLDTFYNPERGYLASAVETATHRRSQVCQNVTTMGMDYPYMEYLLYPKLRAIAEFQAYELYHPAGRSAVAYWDRADEMWHNCIMFQHIAHEMRTARAAGLGDEIERMMRVYLDLFDQYKTARETHNIVGCNGDEGQRADWQAFGARALYSGIIEGLIGIQCDLGGFQYQPCDVPGDMGISGMRFRKGKWDVRIKGQGAYVKRFVVDGKNIAGTMKMPAEYLSDARKHSLLIERSRVPFKTPVLLSAVGAAVTNLKLDRQTLSFSTNQKAHAKCKVYSTKQPSVAYGNHELPVQWYADRHVAWFDVILEPGKFIVVRG